MITTSGFDPPSSISTDYVITRYYHFPSITNTCRNHFPPINGRAVNVQSLTFHTVHTRWPPRPDPTLTFLTRHLHIHPYGRQLCTSSVLQLIISGRSAQLGKHANLHRNMFCLRVGVIRSTLCSVSNFSGWLHMHVQNTFRSSTQPKRFAIHSNGTSTISYSSGPVTLRQQLTFP